jgi:polyhydroxyalkanoate synthesis regulator phasin
MRHMNRSKKLTFGATGLAVAALVVGLGAAGAVAASRILSPQEESKAVIDDAAKQLGVKPEALSEALKQALKNRIDAAVDAGVLTKEQAKALEERIDSGDYPSLFGLHGLGRGLGGHPFGPHGFRDRGPSTVMSAAASYLGMSLDDLREALDDKTLAEIAKEKGKSVAGLVAAIVAAESKKIEQAVADGRITQAQATEITSKLKDRMQSLVDGELHGPGDFRHRFWPGSGYPRGPPPWFAAPRA